MLQTFKRLNFYHVYSIFILFIVVACEENVQTADERIAQLELETLPSEVDPAGNRSSPSKQILGKFLFFDPILSGEKDIACATCHIPSQGYVDGLDLSIGVGGRGFGRNRIDVSGGRIPIVGRNSQTIINTAFNGIISFHQDYDPRNAPMFWDGRSKGLEEQTYGPMSAYSEMRGDGYGAASAADSIVNRLSKIDEYKDLFNAVFGSTNNITQENIGKAIAAFERTIVSVNSPYDQYVKGDKSALSEQQKLGLILFYTKANCAACHSGPMFSDYNYYNLGIPYNPKRVDRDKGAEQKFWFRTPSLRNVTLTAPYMHDGMFATLESVIDHYKNAKSENPDVPSVDPKLQPLDLSAEETDAIINFLKALTDESYDKEMPTRVPSGLKPAGS